MWRVGTEGHTGWSRAKQVARLLLLPAVLGSSTFSRSAAAQSDQPFIFAEDTAPSSLNPVFQSSMTETRIDELMFDGLFSDDRMLNPAPALASEWTVAEDKKSIRIKLADRQWQDGTPISAEDVAFTVAALQDPQTGSPDRATVSFIKSVKVIGPKEVEITFDKAERDPVRKITFKLLPKHKFPGAPPVQQRDPFRVNPVGSGAYKFSSWKDTQIQVQSRTPGASIKTIQAKFVGDKSAQLQLLQYGGVHAIIRVLPKHRAVVKGLSDKIDLLPYESLSWWYIGINHKNPDLAKLNVRKALEYALDRDELRNAHLGDGQTISGPFAPRSQYYNSAVAPFPYDPSMVQKLMKEAGYAFKDGGWTKGGKKVQFTMVLDKDWDVYKDVCLDIQSRLKKAGFEVTIEWADPAAWVQRVQKEGKFDLTINAWTFDETSNVSALFLSNGSKNYIGYANPEMDKLLNQSAETLDPEVFLALQQRVHELAHNDLPYIFLWSLYSYTAITNQVTGVDIHPFRYFTWIKNWRWRDEGSQDQAKQ